MNREEFCTEFNVSCETRVRLETFATLLQKWSRAINLLGPTETEYLWERHIADSGQIIEWFRPDIERVIDFGSGAGLPGLILAVLHEERSTNTQFFLIEADKRKAAFLREASRQIGATVTVLDSRSEEIDPFRFAGAQDV